MNYRILNVLITARDRRIITLKCIDSLLENTKNFDKINIYLFENLSHKFNPENFNSISNLLAKQKIVYYSYDTKESSSNCFAKAMAFYRWLDMMLLNEKINKNRDVNVEYYYLLCDNDMLVGDNWDSYFIYAYKEISSKEPLLHFLIKFPGGIPNIKRPECKRYLCRNKILNKEFEVAVSNSGGGSGFWFMDQKSLSMLRIIWTQDLVKNTYNQYKGHDILTWKKIKNTYINANYLGAILPPEDNPLVLHLGGLRDVGSICLTLSKPNKNSSEYDRLQKSVNTYEERIKGLSHNEIFEEMKNFQETNIW